MSTQQHKMRLTDLETISTANHIRRARCLEELHKLPLTAKAADIERVVKAEFPPLMDEIIVIGTKSLTAALRRPASLAPAVARERWAETKRNLDEVARTIVDRVQVGSAVVEYLDKIRVDGRPLGDCSSAELQREQARLTHQGESLLGQARFFAKLMRFVGPNETVRTSSNRAAILDVLRAHFEPT